MIRGMNWWAYLILSGFSSLLTMLSISHVHNKAIQSNHPYFFSVSWDWRCKSRAFCALLSSSSKSSSSSEESSSLSSSSESSSSSSSSESSSSSSSSEPSSFSSSVGWSSLLASSCLSSVLSCSSSLSEATTWDVFLAELFLFDVLVRWFACLAAGSVVLASWSVDPCFDYNVKVVCYFEAGSQKTCPIYLFLVVLLFTRDPS